MTWMMVGAMAASAAQSMLGASATNKRETQQGITNSQREAAAWDENAAQNLALQQTNLQNVIRTGYKVGLLNVQRAQAKKAAMQQGIDLSRSALSARSAAEANAGATGSIGSSVSAIEHDIAQRVDEAGAQLGADYEAQEQNFDVMLHDLIVSGQDAQGSAIQGNIEKAPPVNTISTGKMLFGAGAQMAGQYYTAKMQMGTGDAKTPAPKG